MHPIISRVILVHKTCISARSSIIAAKSIKSYSVDSRHIEYLEIPSYPVDKPQSLETRKARLTYQSRKRGMLENDLLLSTFAKKYLKTFNEQQTLQYDKLINSPSNDWDIFYWMIGKKATPEEFDNEVMDLLKEHAKNGEREARVQPTL